MRNPSKDPEITIQSQINVLEIAAEALGGMRRCWKAIKEDPAAIRAIHSLQEQGCDATQILLQVDAYVDASSQARVQLEAAADFRKSAKTLLKKIDRWVRDIKDLDAKLYYQRPSAGVSFIVPVADDYLPFDALQRYKTFLQQMSLRDPLEMKMDELVLLSLVAHLFSRTTRPHYEELSVVINARSREKDVDPNTLGVTIRRLKKSSPDLWSKRLEVAALAPPASETEWLDVRSLEEEIRKFPTP